MSSFEIFQTYTKLVGHLAWPFVFLLTLWFLRTPVVGLLTRITELKYGDLSMSFGEAARIAMGLSESSDSESTTSPGRRKAYQAVKKEFIVESSGNANGAYTIFGNGIIVVKQTVSIPAGRESSSLVFPASLVNEVISVQFVGEFTPQVKRLRLGGMELSYAASSQDRTIEYIVTGL